MTIRPFQILAFLIFAVAIASAQPPRVPVKITPRNVPFKNTVEIPTEDWQEMAKAFDREDWVLASNLSAAHLQSLAKENDKKQVAQLRYLHLFALAGKVLYNNEIGNTAEAEKATTEIDLVLARFVGKEILLPARPFAKECAKKLNVVCATAETPDILRSTATNRSGTAIHSFDYVGFENPVDIKEFEGRNVFVGGILQRAEMNEDKTKPWVMRLVIKNGNLRIVLG